MKIMAINRKVSWKFVWLLAVGLIAGLSSWSLGSTSGYAGTQLETVVTQDQALTAAEKKAKRKARQQRKKAKKKKRKIKKQKATQKKVKKKQKKQKAKIKKQGTKKKKLNTAIDKKRKKKATGTAKARPSVKQLKAERKRRARRARRVRNRNVWYSERRAVRYRGRDHYVRSRRVLVSRHRWRNRYRHGRSIYYLPPEGAIIAASAFVISAALARPDVIYDTLYAPPVIPVSRRYEFDEIIEDPSLRQMVRSVDMDINFRSGSAQIPDGEFATIDAVAGGMTRVLQDDPNAVFLIEGHTDATGDPQDNILLSEDRAATVVGILQHEYGIPQKNLEAVGYGAQYLKEETHGPSQVNRRVVVRNISGVVQRN